MAASGARHLIRRLARCSGIVMDVVYLSTYWQYSITAKVVFR